MVQPARVKQVSVVKYHSRKQRKVPNQDYVKTKKDSHALLITIADLVRLLYPSLVNDRSTTFLLAKTTVAEQVPANADYLFGHISNLFLLLSMKTPTILY